MTWGDMFDKATDLYPGKIGLVDDAGRLTYAELREKVDRLAVAFIEMGIKPRDWVLLQFPNWHEYIVTFFAMQKIGALTLLLIPRHNQSEINHLARLTKPVAWIVPKQYGKVDYQPMIDDVVKENPQLKHVVLVRAGKTNDRYPTLDELIEKTTLTRGESRGPGESETRPGRGFPHHAHGRHDRSAQGERSYPQLLHRQHRIPLEGLGDHEQRRPHGRHARRSQHGHALGYRRGVFQFRKARPLRLHKAGGCLHVDRERKGDGRTLGARRHHPRRHHGGTRRYDLSSLRAVCLGGAPSTPELIRTAYEKLKCTVINGFGSSEGTNTSTRPGDSIEIICNSVGRPACPYDTIKIIDEAGNEVPLGAEGELVSKGPGVFTGYFKSPEENREIFTTMGSSRPATRQGKTRSATSR